MKKTDRRKKPRRRPAANKKKTKGVISEVSAGGVVFRRTSVGLRVALIKDPYNKWTFAKGHVEPGESLEEAAVRETQEEMGLRSLRVVAPLGTIELRFTDHYRPATRGRAIHKVIHYFLLQAAPRAYGKPQRSEKIKGLVWVPLSTARKRSGYGDAMPILTRALKILRRRERSRTARSAAKKKKAVSSRPRHSCQAPRSRTRAGTDSNTTPVIPGGAGASRRRPETQNKAKRKKKITPRTK